MNASDICRQAADLVSGERRAQYGDPTKNFARIAAMWSAYLDHPVSPIDVCAMMVLLKTARLAESNTHLDSAVDIAGYAGLIGELME